MRQHRQNAQTGKCHTGAVALALLALLVVATPMSAGEKSVADCEAVCPPLRCSGNSEHVAWYAIPTKARGYISYYFGGGGGMLGHGPAPLDGTWGRDYQGFRLRLVRPKWWHHRRPVGAGAYESNAPFSAHR